LNQEERFQNFRRQNQADIEQELLGLAHELPSLAAPLTDALRMLALCDLQEKKECDNNTRLLTQAADLGLLAPERELPLPSTFMAMTRSLGDAHHLIIAPAEIDPHNAKGLVQ